MQVQQPRHKTARHWLVGLICALACLAHAEPDEEALGKSAGYPVSPGANVSQMQYRVGSWSALDKVPGARIHTVEKGERSSPLPKAATAVDIRYRHRNVGYSLDEYLERRRITGLLILKNGEIVAERYRYDRNDQARFLSFSMAKSITSLLMGGALDRGLVKSIDDTAGLYVKELADSPYGQTSIRHLLRMSSGLRFTERYDGQDDVAKLSRSVATGNPPVTTVLRSITDRHSPSGEKFIYASAETEVLGRVLSDWRRRVLTAQRRGRTWHRHLTRFQRARASRRLRQPRHGPARHCGCGGDSLCGGLVVLRLAARPKL